MPQTEVIFFRDTDDRAPVIEWLEALRNENQKAWASCRVRIEMLRLAQQRADKRNLQIVISAAMWRIDPSRPNPTRRILDLIGNPLRGNGGGYEAIRLLGELGPAAQEAVPALLEACKSSGGSMLRDYALEALEKIDPKLNLRPGSSQGGASWAD